jgi:hypothetical protein
MSTFTVRWEGKLEAQGGGHGRISQCQVVFAAISKPLDHQEGTAYRLLQSTPLSTCIPKLYGVVEGSIIIEDLTAGFESPCMADFKVGTRHYDLQATPEKIQGLIEKQRGSTTDSHGVRLIDAKVRRGGEVARHWPRPQGLKLSIAELAQALTDFLPRALRAEFNRKIQVIAGRFAETVTKYPGFRMYASSVLAAYDGDDMGKGIRVVLIDFAHTFLNIADAGGSIDDPYLNDGVAKGLATLCALTA